MQLDVQQLALCGKFGLVLRGLHLPVDKALIIADLHSQEVLAEQGQEVSWEAGKRMLTVRNASCQTRCSAIFFAHSCSHSRSCCAVKGDSTLVVTSSNTSYELGFCARKFHMEHAKERELNRRPWMVLLNTATGIPSVDLKFSFSLMIHIGLPNDLQKAVHSQ